MAACSCTIRDEDIGLNFGKIGAKRPWGQYWRQTAAVTAAAGRDKQAEK
jgi:hypothetical protein